MSKLPTIKADFLEAGSGPVVMLVHSSVSGARDLAPADGRAERRVSCPRGEFVWLRRDAALVERRAADP